MSIFSLCVTVRQRKDIRGVEKVFGEGRTREEKEIMHQPTGKGMRKILVSPNSM